MKKPAIGQRAPDFTLPDTSSHDRTLQGLKGSAATVVVFTCNHCPYAQAYEDRLIAIQRDYQPKGVHLIAINSNDCAGYPEDCFDNMVKRAQKKQFNFPYLRDETQRTARGYGAEYTPEAYLLDAQLHVHYIGRIDDNWQHPDKARHHTLRAALDALLTGQPVENPVTHAIGCSIKWKL